jgi:hypothetical protein
MRYKADLRYKLLVYEALSCACAFGHHYHTAPLPIKMLPDTYTQLVEVKRLFRYQADVYVV